MVGETERGGILFGLFLTISVFFLFFSFLLWWTKGSTFFFAPISSSLTHQNSIKLDRTHTFYSDSSRELGVVASGKSQSTQSASREVNSYSFAAFHFVSFRLVSLCFDWNLSNSKRWLILASLKLGCSFIFACLDKTFLASLKFLRAWKALELESEMAANKELKGSKTYRWENIESWPSVKQEQVVVH